MQFEFPQNIQSDFDGYAALVDLSSKIGDIVFDDITLDLNRTAWFEANLTAVLGAILSDAQDMNNIKFIGISESIEQLLSRNHFLSHFGGLKVPDYYATTIKYRKFKITEEKLFQEYSLYDVCQRLDKVIEKLQKIIDQNEKTIEALKQDNKESKVIERLNSIESQNKQILDLVKPMR